jgi:hypothetical protein
VSQDPAAETAIAVTNMALQVHMGRAAIRATCRSSADGMHGYVHIAGGTAQILCTVARPQLLG